MFDEDWCFRANLIHRCLVHPVTYPICGESNAQRLLQPIELEELAPIGEAVRVWVK